MTVRRTVITAGQYVRLPRKIDNANTGSDTFGRFLKIDIPMDSYIIENIPTKKIGKDWIRDEESIIFAYGVGYDAESGCLRRF